MTNSAIFVSAVSSLRTSAPSAIFSSSVSSLRSSAPSAIFTDTVEFTIPTVNVFGSDISDGQPIPLNTTDSFVDTAGNSVLDETRQLLSTVTGVDAAATGSTALYTVPNNKQVMITDVIVQVESATGVTDPATVGVGVAAGEDDIILPTQLIGALAANQSYHLDVTGQARIAAAGETISFGVDIAITGTSQNLSVYLIGVQTST